MRSTVIVFLLLLHLMSNLESAGQTEMGRLSFVISTTFGEPLEKAHVTLKSVGPNQKLSGSSDARGEIRFEPVPFGLYDVEVRLLGFEPRRERLGIYQKQAVYRLGLVLGYPHSTERPEIVGFVSPIAGDRSERWVRLVSLFGGDLVENAVDGSGSFRLTGMAPGRYLLIVLERDKILSTKSVDVLAGSKTVNVSLDEKHN